MMCYYPLALPKVIEKINIPTVEDQIKVLQQAHIKALASHELTRQHM